MNLMTVAAARALMLGAVSPLGSEAVALDAALGLFLAEEVFAPRDQPPFAAASMDGWALRAADGDAPRRIVGESAAGRGYVGDLGPGEAIRIFTGAAVPQGADSVVIQENARREGDRLHVAAPALGANIRSQGKDFAQGARLLSAGVRLDPWRLALAAAAGRDVLQTARRPTITILSTGDEVVPPGAAPGPFQIFDSGSAALVALVRLWGGGAVDGLRAGDDEAAIRQAVSGAGGDLLVTLGGASVGDHDLVKPALGGLGLKMIVASVAVRPGKPTWFGRLGDGRLVLGLPGNPASALVCAELFLRPLLLALQGAAPDLSLTSARLAAPLKANGEREHWMRARLTEGADGAASVQPFGDQDSSLVTVFAEANALIRQPARGPAQGLGEVVEVLRLARL